MLEQNNEYYRRSGKLVIDVGPSGRKEKGESDVETALREIREETGLNIRRLSTQILHTIWNTLS